MENVDVCQTNHRQNHYCLFIADKPKDVNGFLEPFVHELNDVLENGIFIDGRNQKFKLRCFICDTPARSMLRGNFTVIT